MKQDVCHWNRYHIPSYYDRKVLKMVNRVALFKDLDEDEIDLLKPLLDKLSFRAGTVIFKQGEAAEFLYVVIDGKVEISFKPYDGPPITVSHVEKGGLFGWSALVGSEKYTSSAIAIEDLETFRVLGSKLRKLCLEHPRAGKDILEHLADRVSSRWKNAHQQVKFILLQGLKN